MNQKSNKQRKKSRFQQITNNNLHGNMNKPNFIANLQHSLRLSIVYKQAQLKDKSHIPN